MVDDWAQKGIRVLTYINSFFSDPIAAKSTSTPTNPHANKGSHNNDNNSNNVNNNSNNNDNNSNNVNNNNNNNNHNNNSIATAINQLRNLYQEGLTNKYFVQNKAGQSYRLHSGSIEFCMLDTTNPAAREWMKDIIKYEMIRNTSSSGWMADFGEYLPFDGVLYRYNLLTVYIRQYVELSLFISLFYEYFLY
jgi:hypothetical protein